ncbi:MAG: hypothetical protein ACFE96_01685 [Candidatus Hermodarchaeota archaeon]
MISKSKFFRKLLVKRLSGLVLGVLVITSIITFPRICYGKGELHQNDRDGWYVYVYGSPVVGFNEVYIDNPELFSDVLKPQNIGMEVFYAYYPPNYILPLWGPRSWDFVLIMNYNDFIGIFNLTILFVLTITFITLIHILNNRKNYLIVNRL